MQNIHAGVVGKSEDFNYPEARGTVRSGAVPDYTVLFDCLRIFHGP